MTKVLGPMVDVEWNEKPGSDGVPRRHGGSTPTIQFTDIDMWPFNDCSITALGAPPTPHLRTCRSMRSINKVWNY